MLAKEAEVTYPELIACPASLPCAGSHWLATKRRSCRSVRCAHMIRAEPRRLVSSKNLNPCSSFVAGERTGERR
jgi:hypothetical protein